MQTGGTQTGSTQTGIGKTGLVRTIGRWSLAALAVNSIIGSGIFGLPAVVAALLGKRSVLAVLIAGAAMAVIMACFAEVASQFSDAGGPYLYARTAFGRFIGILVGWMFYLAQTAAPAANANLFVIYLAEFWPAAKEPWPRFVVLTLLVGLLALINLLGARQGIAGPLCASRARRGNRFAAGGPQASRFGFGDELPREHFTDHFGAAQPAGFCASWRGIFAGAPVYRKTARENPLHGIRHRRS